MSMGNKSSCQWESGCVSWTSCTFLSELSKSSHRLGRWLCVCQPTCPALPSTFSPPPHPSSHPPPLPLYPRPHWSAVPWLLPADQSAWCLLCLGEVNKLSGQSNRKRGARRATAWLLNGEIGRGWRDEAGWKRRCEKRDETVGTGERRRAAN